MQPEQDARRRAADDEEPASASSAHKDQQRGIEAADELAVGDKNAEAVLAITVAAIAANTANGARSSSHSRSPEHHVRALLGELPSRIAARSPSAARARRRTAENTTICRISLVAIASKIERRHEVGDEVLR